MTKSFCPTCRRTVYRGDGDADSCPVCSSPLIGEPAGARAIEGEQVQPSLAVAAGGEGGLRLGSYFLG